MNRPEILAPAGSMEAMKAAVKAGADAVYMGGSMFGARAYAKNPGQDQFVEAIRYVHFYDKKIYLALNTLLKEAEMSLVGDYLLPYYKAGLDGIIIQDPGVFSFIKRNFPGLPLHASTQMNITGLAAAKLLKEAGASRIIPARELSLGEIGKIKRETGLEIETFVHGALCFCYSGRCLMSSFLGGRSGNRGRCAQPCRLPYCLEGETPAYLLSPKDLCAISLLPRLVQAGIDSFKIEGRMRSPEYVAVVAAMYRRYLDRYLEHPERKFEVGEEDFRLLLEAYNRGGFTEGYYGQRGGPDMMSMENPGHGGIQAGTVEKIQAGQISFHPVLDIHRGDLLEMGAPGAEEKWKLTSPADCRRGKELCLRAGQTKRLRLGQPILRTGSPWQRKRLSEKILIPEKKRAVWGKLNLTVGKPARLTVGTPGIRPVFVAVEGELVMEANERPLTEDGVKKPLLQTGASRFSFDSLEIQMDRGSFLPLGAIKRLRRDALDALAGILEEQNKREWMPGGSPGWEACDARRERGNRRAGEKSRDERKNPLLRVSLEEKEKLPSLFLNPNVDGIYLPVEELCRRERLFYQELAAENKKKLYYAMPRVFRKKEQDEYDKLWRQWQEERPCGLLLRNIDEFAWVREKKRGHSLWEGCELILDHSLYAYNKEASLAYDAWMGLPPDGGRLTKTYPLELSKRELAPLSGGSRELIVYGRIPLMVSAQCLSRNTGGCGRKPGFLRMADRYQKTFYVRRNCRHCYNTVFNGVPLSLCQLAPEFRSLDPASLRLHFTVEEEGEMEEIIRMFYEEWHRLSPGLEGKGEFTRGRYKRGVE